MPRCSRSLQMERAPELYSGTEISSTAMSASFYAGLYRVHQVAMVEEQLTELPCREHPGGDEPLLQAGELRGEADPLDGDCIECLASAGMEAALVEDVRCSSSRSTRKGLGARDVLERA